MSRNATNTTKTNASKSNKKISVIKITNIVLLVLCLIGLILILRGSTKLIGGILGIVLLLATMNLANLVKINKESIKFYSILSIILAIIAIPLLFNRAIFSLALSVPAFILSKKIFKKDSKQILVKVSFILCSIILAFCLGTSLLGGIFNVKDPIIGL